jgi:hypothetical protein
MYPAVCLLLVGDPPVPSVVLSALNLTAGETMELECGATNPCCLAISVGLEVVHALSTFSKVASEDEKPRTAFRS